MAKIENNNFVGHLSNFQPETEVAKPQTAIPAEIPVDNNNDKSKSGDAAFRGDLFKSNLSAALPKPAKPPEPLAGEATVTRVNGTIVIDAGAGDDKIGLTQNSKGEITVSVNGKKQTFGGTDKDNLVIRAGDGNDEITVDKNVTVKLVLEGGNGNDRIRGGSGNDTIRGGDGRDKIEAGAGDDDVDGGAGDDYINGSTGNDKLAGGADNDVIYGGDGNDAIRGNEGNDYLEGSKGDDTLEGEAGRDILSGGIGNDKLKGGDDDDTFYAGQGKDNIEGGKGNNKVYAQADDTVQASDDKNGIKNTVVIVELKNNPGGLSVSIDPNASPEFRERIEADLEMLRSSPNGRKMLEGFDQAYSDSRSNLAGVPVIGKLFSQGVKVEIQEISDDNAYADWENRTKPGKPQPFFDPLTNKRGTPNNVTISMNPSLMLETTNSDKSVTEFPPSVVLFHEMAHGYDMTHGTLRNDVYNGSATADRGIRDSERVAVGLPIDGDKNAKTPEARDDANHPYELTENGLRDEMGLPRRPEYAGRPTAF